MRKYLLLLLLVPIVLLSACAKTEKGNAVVVALKGPTAISMVSMLENVKDLGDEVKVKYETLASPEELTAKLAARQVDFATVPTNQAALLYNKDGEYSLAATSIWGVMYIVSSLDDVKTVSDLKGKTILASGKGTTPDIALRYILNTNKLDPDKDVTVEYLTEHTEVAQKLLAGQTKYAMLPEPFVTNVLLKKPEMKVAVDIQQEWTKASGDMEFPQTCLVVRKGFAKENPKAVQNFLEQYKKSIDYVNQNPKEAGLLAEKHIKGFTAASVEKSISRCNIKFVLAKDSEKAVNQFLTVILKASPKFIGGKLPDENFYFKK